jgi:hypothetical protein
VVDGKVINRELVLRNAERDHAEGGAGIVLRIKTEVYVGCPRLRRRYLRIRYDNFVFIEK